MKKMIKSSILAVSAELLCAHLLSASALAQVSTPPPGGGSAAGTSAAPSGVDITSLIQNSASTKNEVSISGDYLMGLGNVTVPFGFSLALGPAGASVGARNREVGSPERQSSDYFGGTVSYSFGQHFYFDFSYANGSSSGNFPLPAQAFLTLTDPNSSFKIQDEIYQAYVRYVFPLRRTRTFAYLRAGVSFGQTTLTDTGTDSLSSGYEQTDKDQDILGNVGLGVGRWLYNGSRLKIGLQLEGEGFYGHRDQNDQEFLTAVSIGAPVKADIGNELFGGIGRGTLRLEYRLNRSGFFRCYGDLGVEAKYTEINYDGGNYGASSSFSKSGNYSEILWGPYVKVGLRYSF